MESNIRHSLLDEIDRVFTALVSAPKPYAVDGRALHPGLPQRVISVVELRSVLLHPSTCFDARDAAFGAVVRNSQNGDDCWTTITLGLLLHGLRGAAGRLSRGFTGDTDDLDSEIIEGALRAIRSCDTSKDGVASWILWAAFRRGQRLRGIDPDEPLPVLAATDLESSQGHPDLILESAVAAGVITADDAELIGQTRVEGQKVTSIASSWGQSEDTLRHRRRRAERRLVAWIKDDSTALVPSTNITGAQK